MTIDVNSQEFKDAVAAAVAEETKGLKEKNTQLLAENRKFKQSGEITPEQLARVEDERDQLAEQVTTLTNDLKTANGSIEDLTGKLKTETGFSTDLIIGNTLSKALTENGVTNPAHLEGATAILRTQAQVTDKDGQRVAMVGDKPLGEFVKEWAGSDVGKNYVAAGQNQGGDAQGDGKGGKQIDTSNMSPTEMMNAGRKANQQSAES